MRPAHTQLVARTGSLQIHLKELPASAAVYSVAETAKANGINVYTYPQYLLLCMHDTNGYNHVEELGHLMP